MGGGVLTLTSFKYSIADHLPSVPYSTKFDVVMAFQFICLCACALESLLAYRVVEDKIDRPIEEALDQWEDKLYVILLGIWSLVWFSLAGEKLGLPHWMSMQPHDWLYILSHQDWQADNDELEKYELRAEKEELNKITRTLDELTDEEKDLRKQIADATENRQDALVAKLTEDLSKKQKERAQKEAQYKRTLESKNAKLS